MRSSPSRNDAGSPSSPREIYGGLRSSWDYGPIGVELKNNIKQAWWRSMVQRRDDIVGLDAAVIMSPKVWEASGHLEVFHDPLVECLDLSPALPRGPPPGSARVPELRRQGLHRPAELQPDVLDAHGPGARRGQRACSCVPRPPRRRSSTSRRSRPSRARRSRSGSRRSASRSATRSRRGTSSSGCGSSSRWRWSSSSSRAPTSSGTSTGSTPGIAGTSTSGSSRSICGCASTAPTS